MDFEALNQEIIACRKCPRLVKWREEVARTKRRVYQDWDYWGRPVPGFGDRHARVLVVGLAPGAHGSNRTGRQFTGDASGDFLFPALHRAGFASQPRATSREDGLTLQDMYITASARCAPPANKPTAQELDNCQRYLEREIELLRPKVIVCLGRVAFERVIKILSRRQTIDDGPVTVNRPHLHPVRAASPPGRDGLAQVQVSSMVFSHGALYKLSTDSLVTDHWLLCSYHPSRQNTSTGRLTKSMFDQIWRKARELLHD